MKNLGRDNDINFLTNKYTELKNEINNNIKI